jgi:uncharacterized protein (TIGR03435 family)
MRKGPNLVLEGLGMNLEDFCKMVLRNRLDRRVIDATGVNPRFNFRLEFALTRARRGSSMTTRPSLG